MNDARSDRGGSCRVKKRDSAMSARTLTNVFAVSAALGLVACGGTNAGAPTGASTGTSLPPAGTDGVFESSYPSGDQGGDVARGAGTTASGNALGAESADASTATGSTGQVVAPPMAASVDGDVARDIEEADIIKFDEARPWTP